MRTAAQKKTPQSGGFSVQASKDQFIANNYLQQTSLFITLHGSAQGAAHGSPHLLAQPPNTELNNTPTTIAITAFFMTTPLLSLIKLVA